ncbi:MAG: right-handed parallel beta-helix repeat-containing protein, partial [Leptospirales bacterium]|nr:right-handed parallel beta-helix repeat-containing protein [Leptospirales bacterium]
GYCQGGVFGFTDSSRITIISTNMYGSGTMGLELSNVSDMKVSLSRIYECTYGIMDVRAGKNILFASCKFRDNQEFTMINVSGTKNISFTNCEFTNNRGNMFYVYDTTVSVLNSTFKDNSTETPIKYSNNVSFKNCVFD